MNNAFFSVIRTFMSCWNCGSENSSYFCRDCVNSSFSGFDLSDGACRSELLRPKVGLLCSACKILHSKIKSTKVHKVDPLGSLTTSCSNCDEEEATVLCLDCVKLDSSTAESGTSFCELYTLFVMLSR